MSSHRVLVVGAGFTGAVVGRSLAEAGHQVCIIDQRSHVAGNCHTEVDEETNVLVHIYGPHIFHTDSERVWDYVNSFGSFVPYRHQVKTTSCGEVFSMPINLHTLNQLWRASLTPDEAEKKLTSESVQFEVEPQNFEEQALSLVGPEVYERFFKGYTQKQWGMSPTRLPASILKRLPVRFSYDDNYFFHRFQGMPVEGYTALVENILNHANIEVQLGMPFDQSMPAEWDHVLWTGPIDEYFERRFGALPYRTLDFERSTMVNDYQGCAVMNYADADVKHTRVTEHKYFSPGRPTNGTVIYREVSRQAVAGDIPYYPIRLAEDEELLQKYVAAASSTSGVTFAGRLGTYRYVDMDVTVLEALELADKMLASFADGRRPPLFSVPPIV